MPYVAGKKFPYTKKGKAEAAAFAKKMKKKPKGKSVKNMLGY